jgi:hypothetical protein
MTILYDMYKVKYLKHYPFEDAHVIYSDVTKTELIELLKNGMITVMEVNYIIKSDD